MTNEHHARTTKDARNTNNPSHAPGKHGDRQ